MWKISARWLPRKLGDLSPIILSSFLEASGRLEWRLPGRKPTFKILEMDQLIHQSSWRETSMMKSVILRENSYLIKKQAFHGYCNSDILHLIGLAASALSELSRIWCQMCLAVTSKLRVCQCLVSMHGKVNMYTWRRRLNNSIAWRKYIRSWDQDHSAGWCKYIRSWNQDHSAGWCKYIRSCDQDHSAGWLLFTI